jgi:hypothetical protein
MTAIEKEEVKKLLLKVRQEDAVFFNEVIQEVLNEDVSKEGPSQQEMSRSERVDAILKRDFERYQEVFKALA